MELLGLGSKSFNTDDERRVEISEGAWPKAFQRNAEQRRVNDSITGNSGSNHFNYITYFPDSSTHAWMDHCIGAGPQSATLSKYLVQDPDFPNTMWCNTCP